MNTTAKTPFDVESGELVDLARFGISVPDGAERLTIGPLVFVRHVRRDPTGISFVYWRRAENDQD